MDKVIRISDKYAYVQLEKPEKVQNDEVRAGYVYDKEEKRIVLLLHVVEDLINKSHGTFALSYEVLDKKNSKKIGVALIDKIVFYLDFIITKCGHVTLMHELGHYLNGELDNPDPDYNKKRNEMLDKGLVIENEYIADEFAVRECGVEKFLKSMYWLRAVRENVYPDKSKKKLQRALFEIDKRCEHAVEYAKTIK